MHLAKKRILLRCWMTWHDTCWFRLQGFDQPTVDRFEMWASEISACVEIAILTAERKDREDEKIHADKLMRPVALRMWRTWTSTTGTKRLSWYRDSLDFQLLTPCSSSLSANPLLRTKHLSLFLGLLIKIASICCTKEKRRKKEQKKLQRLAHTILQLTQSWSWRLLRFLRKVGGVYLFVKTQSKTKANRREQRPKPVFGCWERTGKKRFGERGGGGTWPGETVRREVKRRVQI